MFHAVGRINVSMHEGHPSELWAEYPGLEKGGHWKPQCRARQKIAIIIPFRDRFSHLIVLMRHLHPMLQRQMVEYSVFVVEQVIH